MTAVATLTIQPNDHAWSGWKTGRSAPLKIGRVDTSDRVRIGDDTAELRFDGTSITFNVPDVLTGPFVDVGGPSSFDTDISDNTDDAGLVNAVWYDNSFFSLSHAFTTTPTDVRGGFVSQVLAQGYTPVRHTPVAAIVGIARSEIIGQPDNNIFTGAVPVWGSGHAAGYGSRAWGIIGEARQTRAVDGPASTHLFGDFERGSDLITNITSIDGIEVGQWIGDLVSQRQHGTGDIVEGENTITGLDFTNSVYPGMVIFAVGVPEDTTVDSVSDGIVYMTDVATESGTGIQVVINTQILGGRDRGIEPNTTVTEIVDGSTIRMSTPAIIDYVGAPLAVSNTEVQLISAELGGFNYGPVNAWEDDSVQSGHLKVITWAGARGSQPMDALFMSNNQPQGSVYGIWPRHVMRDFFRAERPDGISQGLNVVPREILLVGDVAADGTITLEDTSDIREGMLVSGNGVIPGSKVDSVTDGTTLALDQPAAVAVPGSTLVFTRWVAGVALPRNVPIVGVAGAIVRQLIRLHGANIVALGDDTVSGVTIPNNVNLRAFSADGLSQPVIARINSIDNLQIGDSNTMNLGSALGGNVRFFSPTGGDSTGDGVIHIGPSTTAPATAPSGAFAWVENDLLALSAKSSTSVLRIKNNRGIEARDTTTGTLTLIKASTSNLVELGDATHAVYLAKSVGVGGAATASETYGAAEQTMLQAVYDAARAINLIT